MNKQQQRRVWLTVAFVVALIGLVVFAFVNRMTKPSFMTDSQLQLNGAYVLPKPRVIKPIQLIDHNGETFDLSRLEGKWTMLFFGFTNCPDVCPATMSLLRQLKILMGDVAEADDLQVVMLSVDPARDKPEVLKPYVEYFDKSFVGVTGEFLDLQAFATNLNAAFYKVPGGGDNYQIDHTANVVLINPYGHYHGFYKPQLDHVKMKITYRSIHATFKRLNN